MNKFKNYLAVMALATASLGAFAFEAQNPDPNKTLFANQGGTWIELEEGVQYRCESASSICVAQFQNDVPGQQMTYSREGRFTD
ncbi:DUF6520 family protein [Cesiribacter sp. SM1]|uniref:DUF6520 family protein n=1 Tax=Cesiribacter sp. SM1 TaxID=2861196 RepID=UPI001CD1B049|nr:DUF6520 family protein [Cesiribacter sp. SM1]